MAYVTFRWANVASNDTEMSDETMATKRYKKHQEGKLSALPSRGQGKMRQTDPWLETATRIGSLRWGDQSDRRRSSANAPRRLHLSLAGRMGLRLSPADVSLTSDHFQATTRKVIKRIHSVRTSFMICTRSTVLRKNGRHAERPAFVDAAAAWGRNAGRCIFTKSRASDAIAR